MIRPAQYLLQQYLPFTVLKHHTFEAIGEKIVCVATVLTVYGIETKFMDELRWYIEILLKVATVLTVYGIETICIKFFYCINYFKLQQYLPFTVLKRMKGTSTQKAP